MRRAQAGDVVLLVGERDRRKFIRCLQPGRTLQTHRGILKHDALIGKPFGSRVLSHLGFSYFLFLPTTDELVRHMRRKSQIIFPKDSGYIMMKLGIRPGVRVIESGTGSGGLCLALATMVGDNGHVYSYDSRSDMQRIAHDNLKEVGLDHRVTFVHRDATQGFDEIEVDALFLDMLTPWQALNAAHGSLHGGGTIGCLVPTTNQLSRLLQHLEHYRGFGFAEAEEIMLRAYKVTPARVRPEDRMVGHTGYLVFARALDLSDDSSETDSVAEEIMSQTDQSRQENGV